VHSPFTRSWKPGSRATSIRIGDANHVAGAVPAARCTDPVAMFGVVGFCGDGCAVAPEECGEPGLPVCPGESICDNCRCTVGCGNSVLDPGEDCDPPAAVVDCTNRFTGYCDATCQSVIETPTCGDGCISPSAGEACDPSVTWNCGVARTCTPMCTCP
jgi:hypothetical protein